MSYHIYVMYFLNEITASLYRLYFGFVMSDIDINKKLFPAYTRAIFDCVVRKAYNRLTVITSSIANSPK